MLTPLGLDREYGRVPYATWVLLALNALVFTITGALTLDNFSSLRPYCLDPVDFHVYQLVTSTFLHADLAHLLGNLLVLWVFVRYLEDRVGSLRCVALYLLFGAAGDLAYLAQVGQVGRPGLGASGAISGVTAVAFFAAPRMRVRMFFFYFFSARVFLMPVWLLIGLWLVLDILASDGTASIHLGGFLAGLAAQVLLRQPFFADTGWSLAREAHGGVRSTPEERKAAATETMYRMLDQKSAAPSGPSTDSEPKIYDIAP